MELKRPSKNIFFVFSRTVSFDFILDYVYPLQIERNRNWLRTISIGFSTDLNRCRRRQQRRVTATIEIVSRRLLPIVFQSLLIAVSTGKLHTRRVLSRIGLASSLFFNGSSACCLFNNVLDHARPVDAAVCYGMSTPMLVWVGVKDWQGGDEKASLLVDSEAGLLRHGLPLIFQCWYTRQYDVLDWFSGGGSCWIARIRCFSPYSITRQRAGISPSLRKRIRNRLNEHRLASWPVLDPPSRKNLLSSALSRSPRQIASRQNANIYRIVARANHVETVSFSLMI